MNMSKSSSNPVRHSKCRLIDWTIVLHKLTEYYNRQELAQICEVTPQTVSRWLHTGITPNSDSRRKLMELLKEASGETAKDCLAEPDSPGTLPPDVQIFSLKLKKIAYKDRKNLIPLMESLIESFDSLKKSAQK